MSRTFADARRFLLASTLCLLAAPPSLANLSFEHFNIEDGLAQSSVNCILQDRHGFLWIGTQDGLNRFDGYRFEVFRNEPDTVGSLSNSTVNAILEDSFGRLWIGTEGGVDLYEEDHGRFRAIPYHASTDLEIDWKLVNGLVEDSSERIWVSTDGGVYLIDGDPGSETLTDPSEYPELIELTQESDVTALAVSGDASLWLGKSNFGLIRLQLDSGEVKTYSFDNSDPESLQGDRIEAITADPEGGIWIGTRGGGLTNLDPTTDRLTSYRHDPSDPVGLPGESVRAVTIDRDNQVWVGTVAGGLARFDRDRQVFEIFANDPRNPRSLSYDYVRSIAEDAAGILWVGTDGGGLCKRARHQEAFEIIRHGPDSHPDPSAGNMVMGIAEDHQGRLWIASYGGGLTRLNRETGEAEIFLHDPKVESTLADNIVMALLHHSSGTSWIGTGTRGIDRFEPETGTFAHYRYRAGDPTALSADEVWSLTEARNGDIWVGTEFGLNRMHPTSGTFRQYLPDTESATSLSSNLVTKVYLDSKDTLWVGTDKGLNRMTSEAGHFEHYRHDATDESSLCADYVMSIVEADGAIWIATYGAGFCRLDPSTETFQSYSTKDGLANAVVYEFLPAPKGGLWMSTNAGLSFFAPPPGDGALPDSEPRFRNFDTRFGLQSNEFNQGAVFKSPRTGEMFFGGIAGTTAFFPEEVVASSSFIPPIVLTDFRVFNETVPVGKLSSNGQVILSQPLADAESIVLSYEENVFSFEFAALDFALPDRNLYAYMMEGFDPDWVYTDANTRTPTYTNLDPGKYVFRVRASNHDLTWNEEGLAIEVVITPPFWETWWFRALMVLVALLLVVIVVETRTISVKRKNLDLERVNRLLSQEVGERIKAEAKVSKLAEELEERVQQRTFELEASNQELEAFAYSVSHDLRAPLRAIDGFSEIIVEDGIESLTDDQKNYFGRLRASAQRMSLLIDQLLRLSRITRIEMTWERVDLTEIAMAVVEDLRAGDPERVVEIHIDPEMNTQGDHQLLGLVVQNLIGNAWKFSRDRNPAEIRFGRFQREQADGFSVSDNGAGFEMAHAGKLFGPFQRLHGRNEFEGTGVGLATVQRIVRRHRGTIWAESEPDLGATFFFTLDTA